MNQEQVIAGFNQLRQSQRTLSNKIVELESDLNEHSLVIEALKKIDESRKCYRLIGGVLVERNVKEVLPAIIENKDMISKSVEMMKDKVIEKGKEINEYVDKHNIQIRREPWDAEDASSKSEDDKSNKEEKSSSGVLVDHAA